MDEGEPERTSGYLVHFSPRTGKTQGTLLEYGFTGAQTLLAYASIRYGYAKQRAALGRAGPYHHRLFCKACQPENGFAQGMYDTAKRDFVFWFTGILLPFQYSSMMSEPKTLPRFANHEGPVSYAKELREIKGNYTRTMCESIYPILLAYRTEQKHGHASEWLAAGERFGAFLLRTQAEDGSWYRGTIRKATAFKVPANGSAPASLKGKAGQYFRSRC